MTPLLRFVPTADPKGLPAPENVTAIEAVQGDKGFFVTTITIDGDTLELGLFPNWPAVLGTMKDHIANSRWPHWSID